MAILEQVLDLNCCIESDVGELSMESACDTHGMCRAIEEVRITESDMAHALCCLCSNICQHILGRYSKETSVIDWCNWTMETGMFATTRCFGIPGKHLFSIELQTSVTIRRRKLIAFWHYECSVLNPWVTDLLACADTWNRRGFIAFQVCDQIKYGDFIFATDC